jgi:hypothetical protein
VRRYEEVDTHDDGRYPKEASNYKYSAPSVRGRPRRLGKNIFKPVSCKILKHMKKKKKKKKMMMMMM